MLKVLNNFSTIYTMMKAFTSPSSDANSIEELLRLIKFSLKKIK